MEKEISANYESAPRLGSDMSSIGEHDAPQWGDAVGGMSSSPSQLGVIGASGKLEHSSTTLEKDVSKIPEFGVQSNSLGLWREMSHIVEIEQSCSPSRGAFIISCNEMGQNQPGLGLDRALQGNEGTSSTAQHSEGPGAESVGVAGPTEHLWDIQNEHRSPTEESATEESLRRLSAQQPNAFPPTPGSSTIATQIAPAMLPEDEVDDEAYSESTSTSYVTSIASSISKGILENERLYPNYGQHSYGMPIDEDEMDRMDLQHRKYELLLQGRHFLAPIGPNPQRILDLGTGTGIWALDVADMYPSASVIGVDVAPIQPKWVAANCQFEIDDVEAEWTYKRDSFDFIHFRDPLYCVRDWPRLAAQCYEHLKPGGWCELACVHPVVMCDDGTMPADSGFKIICDKFMEASAIFGTPTSAPRRFAMYLRNAGFVDVSENVFKLPSSPWPKDKRLKQIGALEMTNVVEGSTAFGLRAFEQAFGWTREKTEFEMVKFRKDVKNRSYHQYVQYFVVYARRPPEGPDPDFH